MLEIKEFRKCPDGSQTVEIVLDKGDSLAGLINIIFDAAAYRRDKGNYDDAEVLNGKAVALGKAYFDYKVREN